MGQPDHKHTACTANFIRVPTVLFTQTVGLTLAQLKPTLPVGQVAVPAFASL